MVKEIDFNSNLFRKTGYLVSSLMGGVTTDHPSDILEIVNSQYRSDRSFPNPNFEDLKSGICGLNTIQLATPDSLFKIPWNQHPFSKGLFLTAMMSFSDQHQLPTVESIFAPSLAREYVEKVIAESDRKRRQITIIEQYQIALEIVPESLLGAALLSHAGSRAIGRNRDTRVHSFLSFSKEEMAKWRDCVSSFELHTGVYGDPPGDTYHFWGAFIGGMTSAIVTQKRDFLLNPLYRFIYNHTAEATNILRYKLAGKHDGPLHGEADRLGFRLGNQVASTVISRTNKHSGNSTKTLNGNF